MTLAQAITVPEFWYGLVFITLCVGTVILAGLMVWDGIQLKLEEISHTKEITARSTNRTAVVKGA